MPNTYTLAVPDMSCGHCRASISAALGALGASAEFDPENRRVRVIGPVPQAAAITALDRIGFAAEPV